MILRRSIWYGQQRVDAPHLRALESSAAGDMDALVGYGLAGGRPLVLGGFEVLVTGAVGKPATQLVLRTAAGQVWHPTAGDAGTVLRVPVDRADEVLEPSNARLDGSWVNGATNYVGVDLQLAIDDQTADVVQFWDPDLLLERPQRVPLARTLDYRIVVTTQDPSTVGGMCPVAVVVLDAQGNVTSIQDGRTMLGRLGRGGAVPLPGYSYSWPGGRTETAGAVSFTEGDRQIRDLKTWMDASMTRLWELGGGEHWYSGTADRNVQMTRSGTKFSNGEWFEWDGTDLHWRGLRFLFDNSTAHFNDVADQTGNQPGLTDLADGECIYVDLDRTTNRTGGTALVAVKASMVALGTPSVPGSRFVIAWRTGSSVITRDSSFPVGSTFSVATPTSLGIVQLAQAAGVPATPEVVPTDANGTLLASAAAGGFPAIRGEASAGNANGVEGVGSGSGAGLSGEGGATGPGVLGSGATGQPGVHGFSDTNAGVRGTATTTGPGVIGESDTGPAFSGIVTDAVSSPAPLFRTSVELAQRWCLDHLGLPIGHRLTVFHEPWDTLIALSAAASPITTAPRWRFAETGAATLDTYRPDGVTLAVGSATNDEGLLYSYKTGAAFAYDDLVTVLEFEFTPTFTSNVDLACGFWTTDVGDSTAWFHFNTTSHGAGGNWRATTQNNGGTQEITNTGVAVTSGTTYRFRIEVHGANTATAAVGGKTVRYFINGTQVAEHDNDAPVATPGGSEFVNLHVRFRVRTEDTFVASALISPITMVSTRTLAGTDL